MEPVVETILVVDDDKINRTLLSIILRNEGYQVVEAEDGEDAVKMSLETEPDLVLLDVMMPKMDGYEACKLLKGDPRTQDIPVIFLSAKTETSDKVMGLDSGGADYVTKPFDKSEVLARVRSQLRIRSLTKEVIEKQKHLDYDLKAAAGIQRSLLPSGVPVKSGLQFAWEFQPCEQIGGDIFNIIPLEEGVYAIYMLDVSGHGVPSALITVSVSQMLQPHTNVLMRQDINHGSQREIVAPIDVLRQLDDEYPMDRFDKYFTFIYMLIDIKRGSLTYSNAGHPPPLLLRPDGTLEKLEKGGPMIGLGGILPFEEEELAIKAGDRIILYTDGVLEYEKVPGEFYGEERFHEAIIRAAGQTIGGLLDHIMSDLMAFGQPAKPRDDITLLGIEYKGTQD